MVRFVPFAAAAIVMACGSTPSKEGVAAPPVRPDSGTAPIAKAAASTAPAPRMAQPGDELSATPELDAEIAAVRQCPEVGSYYSFSCAAYEAFRKPRKVSSGADETRLFSLLGAQRALRFAAIGRLGAQPGPRNTDPARALAAVAVARRTTIDDAAEAKWLGRVIGAVTIDSSDVRDAIHALVVEHPNIELSAATLVGLGVAYPTNPTALDFVDSFRADTRAAIRLGVIDAYAEATTPDYARACTAWAAGLSDEENEVRAATLLAVTRQCQAHHPAVFALAEKRLTVRPTHALTMTLPNLCKSPDKALRPRVLKLALGVQKKLDDSGWYDPLEAIGLCDPRGPKKALAPWVKRADRAGDEARRVLKHLTERRR